MNLKHIPETCQTCGAEPKREEGYEYVGIMHESRVFVCGASASWSSGSKDTSFNLRCPKDPIAIQIKTERVAILKKMHKIIDMSTFTSPTDAATFKERLTVLEGWMGIERSDLR